MFTQIDLRYFSFQKPFVILVIPKMAEIDRKSHQELASEVKQKSEEAATIVENLKSKLSSTANGLSCLDLKNLLMVDYMTNLTYLMLRKSFGKTIEGDPSIERMVENRTVLEKLRPIEKKLKYQVRAIASPTAQITDLHYNVSNYFLQSFD